MAGEEEYEVGDVNTVDTAGAGGSSADEALEYEDGDVNTVPGSGLDEGGDVDDDLDDDFDGSDEDADEDGNRAAGDTPTKVLTYIARSLASEPDAVVVRTEERRGAVRLQLRVAPEDMGRVIGRRGRTAQAIRTLVGVAGVRDGVQTSVDIIDD